MKPNETMEGKMVEATVKVEAEFRRLQHGLVFLQIKGIPGQHLFPLEAVDVLSVTEKPAPPEEVKPEVKKRRGRPPKPATGGSVEAL
jgi:hypothetical protein